MPVILETKDFEQWERGDVKDAAALMKPAASPSVKGTNDRHVDGPFFRTRVFKMDVQKSVPLNGRGTHQIPAGCYRAIATHQVTQIFGVGHGPFPSKGRGP
jgi:hypothetical protein